LREVGRELWDEGREEERRRGGEEERKEGEGRDQSRRFVVHRVQSKA
jgi:hypothetical protein